MHVELVVPALIPAQDPAQNSAGNPGPAPMPALELLLARGRRSNGTPVSLETWLCRAFGLEGSSPVPAGALTAYAHGMDPGADHWLRADPVHLRADRNSLLLIPSQAFSIAAAEAQVLAAALAPLLAGKYELHALRPEQWCLRIVGGAQGDASERSPVDLAGANIDPHLPPKRWHPLLTELQMALYDNSVNTAREERGDPAINSLWLWGAGKLPATASGPWHSVSATDSLVLGLARLAGMRHRAPGAGAAEWLERAPEDGRHLLVFDELRGLQSLGEFEALARRLRELEANWFAPLLAALKSRRIGMLTVHMPEAALSFETARGDLGRFWRRPRPLATYGITPA
jgi:hypothetical protein